MSENLPYSASLSRVIEMAQARSQKLGISGTRPEDLLVALAAQPDDLAAAVLASFGLTENVIANFVDGHLLETPHVRSMRLTKVLHSAERSARLAGNHQVETQDLLLALTQCYGVIRVCLRSSRATRQQIAGKLVMLDLPQYAEPAIA